MSQNCRIRCSWFIFKGVIYMNRTNWAFRGIRVYVSVRVVKVVWVHCEPATTERALNSVTVTFRLCIDVLAVLWVLLAFDHQEHFNRGSVARWPAKQLVNTASWRLHLICCVSFSIYFFLSCSHPYSFFLSRKYLSFYFLVSALHFISCPLIRDRLCDLVVRVPGYTTEMYCVSCEVRTEFIYVM
jgi:hypothetical protein